MTCDDFRESCELYALGLLEDGERAMMADHLQDGCPTCRAELKRALEQNAMISKTVPLVNPPRRLRQRVANSFGEWEGTGQKSSSWQWAYWALAATTILALTIGLNLQGHARRAEGEQSRRIEAQLARMSRAVEIMQAKGTEQVAFKAPSSGEQGSLFVHRRLGVVLVADHLSGAPSGWKYESWIVPKSGAPEPVESFEPDANGQGVSVIPGPTKPDQWKAIAVSMEPVDIEPIRPTKVVFAAPLEGGES